MAKAKSYSASEFAQLLKAIKLWSDYWTQLNTKRAEILKDRYLFSQKLSLNGTK